MIIEFNQQYKEKVMMFPLNVAYLCVSIAVNKSIFEDLKIKMENTLLLIAMLIMGNPDRMLEDFINDRIEKGTVYVTPYKRHKRRNKRTN